MADTMQREARGYLCRAGVRGEGGSLLGQPLQRQAVLCVCHGVPARTPLLPGALLTALPCIT